MFFSLLYFQHQSNARGLYRSRYDPEQLTKAYITVKDGALSIRKAAATYEVPKTTLIDRLHGRYELDVVKSGLQPLFSEEQESLLDGHIKTTVEVRYGCGRQETINLAFDYAVCLGLREKSRVSYR